MPRLLHDRRLTLLLVAFAFAIAAWPVAAGLEMTVEDGYYYFKIARNLSGGAGSTFDGEHPTNGYHPLWLLCLLPLFWIASSPGQALMLGKLAQAVLAALAAGALYCAAGKLAGRSAAAVAVALWVALTHRLWLQGMEYALYALASTATLYVYLGWFRSALPRAAAPFLALGLGCALTFLARLDALLLPAVLGTVLVVELSRAGIGRAALRRLALFLGPIIFFVLLYAVLNMHLFGHALPVSVAVKQSWSERLVEQQAGSGTLAWTLEKARALLRPLKIGWSHPNLLPLVFGLAAIGALILARLAAARFVSIRRLGDRLRPLTPWAGYGLLSYAGFVLSSSAGLSLTPRYYVVQPIVGALIVAMALERLGGRLAVGSQMADVSRLLPAAMAVALMAVTVWDTSTWIRRNRLGVGQPLVDAAAWTARTLPQEARIASWNPGTVAFLADRQVVNLDGLVNSWSYFERHRHDVCGYLRREQITHLVDLFRNDERGQKILPVTPLPPRLPCAERFELLWRDDRYSPDWSVRAYEVRLAKAAPDSGPVR